MVSEVRGFLIHTVSFRPTLRTLCQDLPNPPFSTSCFLVLSVLRLSFYLFRPSESPWRGSPCWLQFCSTPICPCRLVPLFQFPTYQFRRHLVVFLVWSFRFPLNESCIINELLINTWLTDPLIGFFGCLGVCVWTLFPLCNFVINIIIYLCVVYELLSLSNLLNTM